ncbi:MAG: glycosyltransferase [Pseudomonadota bacterium]
MAHTSSSALVSVVIPAFRARETLPRTLASVAAQTYPHLEVIVVEDGSDDGTRALIEAYSHHPARYKHSGENNGAAAARNVAVAEATGDFIAFLDADDEWLPTKIERQMALIEEDRAVRLVACAAARIEPDGTRSRRINAHASPAEGRDAWKHLLRENFFCTPTVLCRRQDVLDLGGFDRSLEIAEDQDLWIRIAQLGPLRYIDEELVRVHILESGLSVKNRGREHEITLGMIKRHLGAAGEALTGEERRSIWARRQRLTGEQVYASGDIGTGAALLWQAAQHPEQRSAAVKSLIWLFPPLASARAQMRRLIGRPG